MSLGASKFGNQNRIPVKLGIKRMILSKEDYFEKSRNLGLPGRCPIYDRCERKAHSIAVANDTDRASECAHLESPRVSIVGDGPYEIKGNSNFLVGGICPELPLFESQNFIIGLNKTPTTKGQYDKYMNPQYEVLETGHFSECAEFSRANLSMTSSARHPRPRSWVIVNYQWLLAFIVSVIGVYYAYLAIPHK